MGLQNKLNLSADKKMLMIHADDAGLCHSENEATIKALQNGLVNSYSIMVPCPAFKEIADFALANPQFDHGIHLTLTCEWKDYKFGPVSPINQVPSLMDSNGHFFKNRQLVTANVTAKEVEKELNAQIDKALEYGLKPSHIDCHMYSLGGNSALFAVYKNLSEKYNLPVLLSKDLLQMIGSSFETKMIDENLFFDNVYVASFSDYEGAGLKNYYGNLLDSLQPGLHMLLIHPAFDNKEMQDVAIDHPNFGAEWRQTDFDFFTSAACKKKLQDNNIELINWHQINTKT